MPVPVLQPMQIYQWSAIAVGNLLTITLSNKYIFPLGMSLVTQDFRTSLKGLQVSSKSKPPTIAELTRGKVEVKFQPTEIFDRKLIAIKISTEEHVVYVDYEAFKQELLVAGLKSDTLSIQTVPDSVA